jgi:hypothetical protein
MSKYGKNGTAWSKAVSVKPVEVVDKIVVSDDFRDDMSDLDRDIFRLECSIKAGMNVKVKGVYYGKKRGIVKTGRKELWWHEKGAFGNGVSDLEKERRELIKMVGVSLELKGCEVKKEVWLKKDVKLKRVKMRYDIKAGRLFKKRVISFVYK